MLALDNDQLWTLVFGDPGGGVWGAAISRPSPMLALGDRGGATACDPLNGDGWRRDGRGWRLEGEGLDLQVKPRGEDQLGTVADEHGVSGYQELCRVHGSVTLAGATRKLDCVGTRCAVEGVDPARLASLRAVSGWFAPDDAFLLVALRPEGAGDQGADLVAATLFDPEGWVEVSDPRLSSTYDAAGAPRRASLEMWVGEGESEFPRRAAGEAQGPGAGAETAGLSLRAVPLRCHSRGREGAGIYLLARF